MSLVVALMCLSGIGAALYPSTASWFSALSESQQVAKYGNDVKTIGTDRIRKALADAHAYNAALDSGALIKANERVPTDEGAKLPTGFTYTQLLKADPYGLMGRIVIPSISADLPIYHGTSDKTLTQGIGHLEGTSLPVGGKGTHAVLAGHRGLASATLFTHLDQVVQGDTFTIYVLGETLSYQVTSVKVVEPDQTRELDPVPGRDLVTLVTCTPIGINSQRILVTGERVLPTPASATQDATRPPEGPGFPWWALASTITVAACGYYIRWSGLPAPRRRNVRDAQQHSPSKPQELASDVS